MATGRGCTQAGVAEGGTKALLPPFSSTALESPPATTGVSRFIPGDEIIWNGVPRSLRKLHDFCLLHRSISDYDSYRKKNALLQASKYWSNRSDDDEVNFIALPEPGKFRIIGVGDGFAANALQPLQGSMLGAWKRRPESTMLHDDLLFKVNELWQRSRVIPGFSFFLSVDYQAATDTLSRQSTFFGLLGVQDSGLPGTDLAFESLRRLRGVWKPPKVDGEGRVVFKRGGKKWEVDEVAAPLTEGQSMGHPLSFPLLCVANLSAWRRSVALWVSRDPLNREKFYDLLLTNVLVNGDDLLAPVDVELYKIFLQCSGDLGFIPSPGKQYLSSSIALINSQLYKLNGEHGNVEVTSILRLLRVLTLKKVYLSVQRASKLPWGLRET